MKKIKVALVTGGFKGEAVVSYKSAIQVEKNIDKNKFEVYKIDITINGWFYESPSGVRTEVNKGDFSLTIDQERICFDVVMMCIHGTPGEDGKLQGYFDLLNIPYTNCDVTTSSLTFNKRYTVAVAAFAGVPVAKSLHLFKNEPVRINEITEQLSLPVFVKPNNGGSSINMSKVMIPVDLESAIKKAFEEDDQVLVEEFIQGREFTIGVFRKGQEIIALPITEIIPDKDVDFFDFAAKYLGKSKEVTPANISTEAAEEISQQARRLYSIFNCRGVVRIDFIHNEKDGRYYMLEVNTVPGQTDGSLIPQQVVAKGWNIQDFYTTIIEEALSSVIK